MTLIIMIFALYGAVVASALASFACVISDRAPRGEKFATGRSHCACGRQLRATENVPVLGWLHVRGVARCCGARIPTRYVVAEAVAGVAGAGWSAVLTRAAATGAPLALILGGVLVGAAAIVALTVLSTWPRAARTADR